MTPADRRASAHAHACAVLHILNTALEAHMGKATAMTAMQIAHVVHEANRAYCLTIGDTSQAMWEHAPAWQKASAVKGVEGILGGFITRPEQSHESWLAEKAATGWVYGDVKDAAASPPTHPCMVPYDDLPPEQQVKDAIFFAIVRACQAGHA